MIKKIFSKKIILIPLILILLAFLSFSLFVFEYKGYGGVLGNKIPQLKFLSSWPKILDIFYLPYQLTGSSLPVYELNIDPKDLIKIEEELKKNTTELLASKYRESVSAELIYQKEVYPIKIRVRGDLIEHWGDKKKSWLITFKDEKLLNGKKKISLIIPGDRGLISEELSNYRAKKLELLFPPSQFVVFKINGRQPAIYFEIENWSEEFLAKAQRPDQSNLYGEEDDLAFSNYTHDLFESPSYWKKYTQDGQSQINDFSDIDLLGDLIYNSSDQEFFKKIPSLLDMDNFYRWQVHSILMGSTHQGFNHNLRPYFDNSRGKFEFIPWDVGQFEKPKYTDLHYNTLVSRILSNPEFLNERNKILWEYVKDDKNLEDDLEFYNKTYNQVKGDFYKDRIKVFSNIFFDKKIKDRRNLLINQYRNIQNTFEESEVLTLGRVFDNFIRIDIRIRSFANITLNSDQLYYDSNENKVFDKKDLKLTGEFQMFSQRKIPSDLEFEKEIEIMPKNYSFFIEKNNFNLDDFKLNLRNSITDSKIKTEIHLLDQSTFKYFDQASYSRIKFLKDNPFFRSGPLENQIILYPGNYQINQNIIIPNNLLLEIKPGVQIRFAPNVSLISYSPVKAIGEKTKPIIFSAQNREKGWGVMAILNSEKSFFENCIFEYGSQSYINGTFFSGQLAIHSSDADIKNCQFKFAQGDDGLNLKKSKISVENNYFFKNGFDGLDLDWVTGEVINNHFSENGNDGLDLGGIDNMIIWGNQIEKSGDKCLSLGEKSKNVIIANNLMNNCQTGIAVKDNSEAKIINNTIINNEIGISVYEKKAIFGGAHPEVFNTFIWSNQKSIELDEKSGISISYSNIEGGFEGKGNSSQELFFQKDSFLLQNSQGDLESINSILKEKLESVPIGLINLPFNYD